MSYRFGKLIFSSSASTILSHRVADQQLFAKGLDSGLQGCTEELDQLPVPKAYCGVPSKALIPGGGIGAMPCARSKWFWSSVYRRAAGKIARRGGRRELPRTCALRKDGPPPRPAKRSTPLTLSTVPPRPDVPECVPRLSEPPAPAAPPRHFLLPWLAP
jgi:hypothetical protein